MLARLRLTNTDRLEEAKRHLRSHPGSNDWYWQVKVKILTFVVNVYGDFVDAPHRPQQRKSTGPLKFMGPKKDVKSADEIRKILERISAAND